MNCFRVGQHVVGREVWEDRFVSKSGALDVIEIQPIKMAVIGVAVEERGHNHVDSIRGRRPTQIPIDYLHVSAKFFEACTDCIIRGRNYKCHASSLVQL